MTVRALIVDDEEEIVRTAGEVVKSLDHDFDSAGDIETARRHLEGTRYDYLILDMNLPLVPQRLTGRHENGRNFITTIRGMDGLATLPIIVITGHDRGESDFILSVMRAGGMGFTQYVQKPIDGDKLDRAIREALTKHLTPPKVAPEPAAMPAAPRMAKRAEPQPFTSGELVFYPDRVELCGVKILGDSGLGHSRRMLDMLREKRRDRFARIGGEELAKRIGKAVNGAIVIGTITGCASTIRRSIKMRLKRELNLVCEDQDVLVRDDQGYHLNDDKITVRDGTDDGDADDSLPTTPENKAGVPADDPEDMDSLNKRQKWILAQTGKGQDVTRARLEEVHEVSTKTAKRDLSDLVKRDLIEYVRKPHPGFYREKT